MCDSPSFKRDMDCPDVILTSHGDTLFSSCWFFKNSQLRILRATLLQGHGCGTASALAAFYMSSERTDLPYPNCLLETCIDSVPKGSMIGDRRMQRTRDNMSMLQAVPDSFAKTGVSVVFFTSEASLGYGNFPLPHFECFIQLVAEKPFMHCYKRFYVDT